MPVKRARALSRGSANSTTANVIGGRIEIRGLNTPAGSLLVRAYDALRQPNSAEVIRLPLGSAITSDGTFEICYDDKQFLAERTDRSRPDIVIVVSAPEGNGGDPDNGSGAPLFESAVRTSAAREEWFLLQLELSQVAKRGLLVPMTTRTIVSDPVAAGSAAEIERARQSQFRDEMRLVRRKVVAETRKEEDEIETDLRERVLKHLTGVAPDMPQWKRFVQPGADVLQVTRESQADHLERTITPITRNSGTFTYLVLSEDEVAALGNPPDPDKVEALLRRFNPTSTLFREDPAAVACLRRREENPIDPPAPAPPTPVTPGSTTISSDADSKVAELIDGIRKPEDLVLGITPDQAAVAANIKGLNLSKGPADIAAFYDFHNLQLAFDHVWEDARAEGYIERAKEMYRAARELGGDPKAALGATRDPMRALTREVALVRQAQGGFSEPALVSSSGSIPSVMYGKPGSYAPTGAGTLGDGLDAMGYPNNGGPVQPPPHEPTPPPKWPPRDPEVNLPQGEWQVMQPVEPASESYPFTVFAANSINFGLLVTYRQCWEPLNYQVGRLVGTRTLAPKETITITTKQVVKTNFNRKQIESTQEARQTDSSETQRDEAEIVQRAQTKTNFALTTQGSYNLGPLGDGTATTTFGRDSDNNSQETKRSVREAVRKESQSYRNERRLELESGTTTEDEATEKREIANVNDELALTYIFYELQRRYRVSEKLHRAIPVILVAQRVPRPEEITEAWVTRYDWIIGRFLPDDSYRAALTYLGTKATGDRIILDELYNNVKSLRAVIATLNVEIGVVRNEAAMQLAALQNFVERKAAIEANDAGDGVFRDAWEWAAGADEESRDSIRLLEEAARERYEKALRDEKDLRGRLERETTALQVATETYTRAYAEHSNQRLQVNRLIQHIRDYILHYMQGIWSYEHPDQQFFRHHTLTAPRLPALTRSYTLTELDEWPVGVIPKPGKQCYQVTFTTEVDPDLSDAEKNATLAELASLDNPLGFKGNYIIYPLKKSNGLTDFMLTPYLDAEFGLRDPDGPGNWTLQEFSEYVQCLRQSLSPAEFAEIEGELRRHYAQLLADPLRDGEDIVVPTKSLYMQMLVDTGKALEGFKEAHRLIDVMKVKAEVRSVELDNLRRAKLVLADKLEDPNVESVKNVYYHGETPPHDGDE